VSIAVRLKELRIERGMTLLQLAEKLNVSEATVQRYESGNIKNLKHDTIVKLADILGITPAYLMGWNEISESGTPRQKPPTSTKLPSLTAKDERSIQKRLEAVLNDLMPNSGLAYYDGEEPMSEETKELLRISLENTMRLAKQMAKQKYTPKKYRN